MDIFEKIEVNDCPKCGGVAFLEDDGTNGVCVSCIDCTAHTVTIDFKAEDDKEAAAQKAADLWNSGKAVTSHPGE